LKIPGVPGHTGYAPTRIFFSYRYIGDGDS
jgi:hypothetical protein